MLSGSIRIDKPCHADIRLEQTDSRLPKCWLGVWDTPIRNAAPIVDQLTGPSNQFCRSPPEASVLMTDSHQARIALRKQIPWALSAYTPASVAVSPTASASAA